METWILIMWIAGGGVSTAEFNNEQACRDVKDIFVDVAMGRRAICVYKGSEYGAIPECYKEAVANKAIKEFQKGN